MDDMDRRVLAIEAKTWRYQGVKEDHIRKELGITATRYYQRLNRLIGDPVAYAEHPVLIKRLRRIARVG
jgi:hypothetical protein